MMKTLSVTLAGKLFVAAAFALLGLIQVALALRHDPWTGHDYAYMLPRLFDVYLHHLCDGWSIQWWTPSFGAGLPAFANPQHTQFMPAQWLVPFLEPFSSAVVSSVCLNVLGGLLVYRTCLQHLTCAPALALVIGLSFGANGFVVQRLLVGHVSFASFPLLAALPLLLARGLNRTTAIGGVALLWMLVVYSGGYAIGMIGVLCCLLLLGILPLLAPEHYAHRELMIRLFWSGLLGGLGCAAKAVAVACWLQATPREGMNQLTAGLAGQVGQFFLRLGFWEWLTPLALLPGRQLPVLLQDIFPQYGLWEQDQTLGAPVLILLLAGLIVYGRKLAATDRRSLALVAIALWIAVEFTLGHGYLWSAVKRLPLLSSFHANFRFGAAFILPLMLVAAVVGRQLLAGLHRPARHALCGTAAVAVLTFLALRFATTRSWDYQNWDHSGLTRAWVETKTHGETFTPIRTLSKEAWDDDVFALRASSLEPYEAIFGYGRPGPRFTSLAQPGPIDVAPPNFNFPPSLLLKRARDGNPFQLMPKEESETMRLLLNRRQPDWPLPPSIRIAGVISVIALAAAIALAALGFFAGRHSKPEQEAT